MFHWKQSGRASQTDSISCLCCRQLVSRGKSWFLCQRVSRCGLIVYFNPTAWFGRELASFYRGSELAAPLFVSLLPRRLFMTRRRAWYLRWRQRKEAIFALIPSRPFYSTLSTAEALLGDGKSRADMFQATHREASWQCWSKQKIANAATIARVNWQKIWVTSGYANLLPNFSWFAELFVLCLFLVGKSHQFLAKSATEHFYIGLVWWCRGNFNCIAFCDFPTDLGFCL